LLLLLLLALLLQQYLPLHPLALLRQLLGCYRLLLLLTVPLVTCGEKGTQRGKLPLLQQPQPQQPWQLR
jgi:hypothetical protein